MSQLNLKLAIVASLVMFVATGCVVIEDGEVGVSKSFGKIKDEPVGQGVVIQVPVIRTVETWNVKLQELKETAQVPSSEGLIVGLDTSLLFQVAPEQAPTIRKTVGWNYVERLIVPYFRSAVRDVVAGYPVKKVYSEEGRKEIATKIVEGCETSPAVQGEHRGQAHRRTARAAEAIRTRAGRQGCRDRGRSRARCCRVTADRAFDAVRLLSTVPVDQDPERESERDLCGYGGEPAAVQERQIASGRGAGSRAAPRGVWRVRGLVVGGRGLGGELRLRGPSFKRLPPFADKA